MKIQEGYAYPKIATMLIMGYGLNGFGLGS